MLEPYEGKLSRTVLRGERDSNVPNLLDNVPNLLDKPRDMEQRLGRMKRQGNMRDKVHEYIYVTQDTFDAYRFQTLEMKQGYISQIMSNSNPFRSCEDVTGEEMGYAAVKAACVGNPLIKEKIELDIAVNELQVLKKGFMNSRYKLEDDVKIHLPKMISSA